MPEQNKADAVLVPKPMLGGGDYRLKMIRLLAIVKPLMGLAPSDLITTPLDPIANCYFVYRGGHNIEESYLFAADHEQAGEHRHDWTDVGNGVKVGTLKPDPAP